MIPAHETKEGDRYGIVRVSPEFLAALLSDGNEMHARVTHGLPPGARVVATRQCEMAGWIELLVSGVEPGEHDIEFATAECGYAGKVLT